MEFFVNYNITDIAKNQGSRSALVKFLDFISYNQLTK